MNNIYLIGFMGSGKSTVAKMLREKLYANLVEMDERIVKEQGMSINDIFARYGETHFRNIETELLRTIAAEDMSVVSCGGGVAVQEENVSIMKDSGRIILLLAKPETIYERVKDSTDRPILNGNMNISYIEELMKKRSNYYNAAADITIVTDGKTLDEICQEIIEYIRK